MKQFNHSIRKIPVRKRGTAAGVTGSFSGGKASGGGQYHPFGGGDNIDFSAARLRLTELVFGDAAVLKYDADKRTVFIEGLDEENNEMNMAASGDVSAFGLEPGESGGSGVSALYEMIDVIKEGDKVKGAVKGASLVYDGAKWYAEVLKSGLDELALSAYLQANKYVQEAALEGYALKGEIPTSVSDLANDAGYITSAALDDYVTSSMADERYHPLGGSDNKDLRVNELYIGNGAKLMFDSVRNSLVLTGTDGETPVNFAALGDVMGFGISDAGGVAYDRLDSWTDYTADKSGWVLSALLGWDLNTRLQAVESKSTSVDYTANVVSGTALGVISIDGVDKTIYAPDSILWSNVAAKPSTLAGYGITDACTKAENKIQWSTGAGGSYIGWVRIAKWTVNTAGYFSPHPFIFSLSRSYNSPEPEQYTLAFTFGWGTASVSQLSGHSVNNHSIIERFRISSSADRLTYYLEYYVNTSYSRYENNCVCTISSYYGDYSSYSFTTLNELANDSEVTVTSIDTATNGIVSNAFVKQGGTSSQFLKADGSVDSNSYALSSALSNYYTKVETNSWFLHTGDAMKYAGSLYGNNRAAAYKITTTWTKVDGNGMPTINIRGYAYIASSTIDIDIVSYQYSSQYWNIGAVSKGSWRPENIYLTAENGKTVIYLVPDNTLYMGQLHVFVYRGFNITCQQMEGWTIEALSAKPTITSDMQLVPWGAISGSIDNAANLGGIAASEYITKSNYPSVLDSRYLQSSTAASTYVKKSGDTMTGELKVMGISLQFSNEINSAINDALFIGYRNTAEVNLCYHNAPLTYGSTSAKIWHAGNDGESSGLDADLLDGYHGNDYLRSFWTNSPGYDCDTYANQPFVTFTYGNHAPFTGPVAHLTADSYGFYLGTSYQYDGPLYYRRHGSITDGTMGAWQQLARITDNVASATRATYIQDNNGDEFYVGTAGETGIGPSYTGLLNWTYGDKPIYFYTNASQRMIITGDGRVGIGTATPSVALDVAGDIHASSNVLADGYIKIGNAKLRYNAANRVLILEGIDGSAINLSTTGDVAAFSNS